MTIDIQLNICVAEDGWTTWHITWGTYGTRLHGGDRPTVEREFNQLDEDFVDRDDRREQFERNRMRGSGVLLDDSQRERIEAILPELCDRGGWKLRICAAGTEGDHVHILLDAPNAVHGKQIRQLLKRWITQALDTGWGKPESGSWWAEAGSTRAVKNLSYLRNATVYIHKQRATHS